MSVMVKSSEGLDFQIPDEGNYVLELTNVGEPRTEPNPFHTPKPGEEQRMRTSVAMTWEVAEAPDDEDQVGVDFMTFYTLSLGSDTRPSNLRPVMTALLGAPVDDEEEYDLQEFLGRRIRGTVLHKPRQNGGVKATLEAPMAIRKKKASKTPALPPPPVEEEVGDDDNPFDEE